MSNKHKSGFVNIIGNPNVGKSTLMNKLVGEKLSIITSKAQTTRKRIFGIVSEEDYQIVFSDTPGILKPVYEMQKAMLNYIKDAFIDADVILYITDVIETPDKHIEYIEKLQQTTVKVLLLVNKIDLVNQDKAKEIISYWENTLPKAEIIPISALHEFNTENILDKVLEHLPESPPYFPKDQLTDKSDRYIVSELIREKVFLRFKQEIPYSVEVDVEEFKEKPDIVHISAIIYVIRDSQKPIIIGKGGKSIKSLGIDSRKEIEAFVRKKVHLNLFVKVKKDWRDNPQVLSGMGY